MARVAVLSLYDLGRPALEAMAMAASVRADGHAVRFVDLAVEDWAALGESAELDAVVLHVPMHTAAQLARVAVARLRAANSRVHIAAAGLYAALAGEALAGAVDAVFGIDTDEVVAWVRSLRTPGVDARSKSAPVLTSADPGVSVDGGPPFALDRYARFSIDGERRLAGAVAASSGCIHRCRHCPVPVAYDGRIRLTPTSAVLAQAEAQIRAGARHLSFTDPDFLNAPSHAARVADALQTSFPGVTFDCTVKIEHVLRHAHRWAWFAERGLVFVVTALECLDDRVLAILDKGHTAADADRAIAVLRSAGIEVRPSLLPFTPWTTVASIADLFAFAQRHALIRSIDPVQYSIRLLLPHGSLLLGHPHLLPYLGEYDRESMSYAWRAEHPETVTLQQRLAAIAEGAVSSGADDLDAYLEMRAAVDIGDARLRTTVADVPRGPRMTEPWFC